jgi:hypothetical protein
MMIDVSSYLYDLPHFKSDLERIRSACSNEETIITALFLNLLHEKFGVTKDVFVHVMKLNAIECCNGRDQCRCIDVFPVLCLLPAKRLGNFFISQLDKFIRIATGITEGAIRIVEAIIFIHARARLIITFIRFAFFILRA